MKVIDERRLKEKFIVGTEKDFYRNIKKYDESMIPVMKARGYTCIRSAERTVAFTFGEFCFSRRKWKRGSEWYSPVDEWLGLDKNSRYSKELIYQIAELSTMMSYDHVVKVIQMMYHVKITKPTVIKTVKFADQLRNQYEEYQYYQEEVKKKDKIKADIIFVEGDGVFLRVLDEENKAGYRDFAHFVIHTGSKKIEKNRWKLENKKSIMSISNRHAREMVLDYLYQNFEITENTILITNSDGGHGYTPYVFKEFAKVLGIKHHEHFWDEFHVYKEIDQTYKSYPDDLKNKLYQSIQTHDKKLLRTVLDTTESLLTSAEEENFSKFSKKFLRNFQYTKPLELRGFRYLPIGIMESQHRKITYRMKKRGMIWSQTGAESMTNMILLSKSGQLRELFFGEWRKEYQEYKAAEELTAATIKVRQNHIKKDYQFYSLKKRW